MSGFSCITLAAGIDPATAVLVASPDKGITDPASDNFAVVEWVSSAPFCGAGTLEVRTWAYSGDDIDDDDGGGNSTGDALSPLDVPFVFVVP